MRSVWKKCAPIVVIVSSVLVASPASALDFDGSNFEELTPITDPQKKVPLKGTIVPAMISHNNTELTYNYTTFYQEAGKAIVEKPSMKPQEVHYGELDAQGRATGAWALVTGDMYEHSKGGPLLN